MRVFNKVIQLLFLIALTTSTIAEECSSDQRKRLLDQDFGMALTPEDLMFSAFAPMGFHDYFRPWRYLSSVVKDTGSSIKTDKDKFQVNLDVQHFAPDEIRVKTAEGYIIVEAKHEEKKDEHGFVSRQFLRRYALPEGAEPDSVVSELSSDGILTITAPRKEVEKTGERVVPITKTGPVRKETKEQGGNEGTCHSDKSCKV